MISDSKLPIVLRMLDASSQDASLYRELRLMSLRTDPQAYHVKLAEAETKPLTFFASEISDPQFGCLGAFSGQELVGMITIITRQEKVNFYAFYVSPNYRNQGIGTKLIQEAISIVKEAGIGAIELSVMSGNPAEVMYVELGFERINTESTSLEKDYKLLI